MNEKTVRKFMEDEHQKKMGVQMFQFVAKFVNPFIYTIFSVGYFSLHSQ